MTRPPGPDRCSRCYIDLPAAATGTVCDDCDGAPPPRPTPPPPPPSHVVHNPFIAKMAYLRQTYRGGQTHTE